MIDTARIAEECKAYMIGLGLSDRLVFKARMTKDPHKTLHLAYYPEGQAAGSVEKLEISGRMLDESTPSELAEYAVTRIIRQQHGQLESRPKRRGRAYPIMPVSDAGEPRVLRYAICSSRSNLPLSPPLDRQAAMERLTELGRSVLGLRVRPLGPDGRCILSHSV